MKRISILGSTGSIGVSTLDIVAAHPDRFQVVALGAGRNLDLLVDQIEAFSPELVAVVDAECARELEGRLSGKKPSIMYGTEGYVAVATASSVDTVVAAIVGAAGLVPTAAAVEAGKDVALANKETLVCAGRLVMEAAARNGISLFPVDSEHSAVFQSLLGNRRQDIKRVILTASGGPFREASLEKLATVTIAEALAHPNWSMGKKITIDSATMMNKGLEVIEARWLFDIAVSSIDVHIHPQSIVHSMVEYIDGSVMAQLGVPDMKAPIAYALSYPERIPTGVRPLDLTALSGLVFSRPDYLRFPALKLAYEALEAGESMPAVMNAANEMAVAAFLDGRIGFTGIPEIIERTMAAHVPVVFGTYEDVLLADRWGRVTAAELINRHG